VSTPILSASESEELLYHNRSSGMASWELDVLLATSSKTFR